MRLACLSATLPCSCDALYRLGGRGLGPSLGPALLYPSWVRRQQKRKVDDEELPGDAERREGRSAERRIATPYLLYYTSSRTDCVPSAVRCIPPDGSSCFGIEELPLRAATSASAHSLHALHAHAADGLPFGLRALAVDLCGWSHSHVAATRSLAMTPSHSLSFSVGAFSRYARLTRVWPPPSTSTLALGPAWPLRSTRTRPTDLCRIVGLGSWAHRDNGAPLPQTLQS